MPKKRTDNTINVKIGTNVRKIRRFKGVSLADAANVLNVSYQQLQKYESGENGLSGEKMLHLSQYLECNITDFFEGLISEELISDNIAKGSDRETYTMIKCFKALPSDNMRAAFCSLLRVLSKPKDA